MLDYSVMTVFRRIRSAVGEPMSYTINYLPKHNDHPIEKN